MLSDTGRRCDMADTEGEHEQRHHERNHRHNLRRNSVPLKIDLYSVGKTEYQGAEQDHDRVVLCEDHDCHRNITASGRHVPHIHIQVVDGKVCAPQSGQYAAGNDSDILDLMYRQTNAGSSLRIFPHHAQP